MQGLILDCRAGSSKGAKPRRKGRCRCISLIITILFISSVILPSLTPASQNQISGSKTPIKVVKPEDLRPPTPKKYNGLRNPLKNNEKNLADGEWLYDINCSACHGGNLDGNGPEAEGFFPRPASFINLLTTIQPKESYLFWRIKEGGPGLPKGWRPWGSAMPAWKEELTDEEIWKIILYIYEAVGKAPQ